MLETYHFTSQTLMLILEDEDFIFPEVDMFSYISDWATEQCKTKGIPENPHNKREVLEFIIHLLRFPILSIQDLASVVTPSELLFTQEELPLYHHVAGCSKSQTQFKKQTRRSVPKMRITGSNYGTQITIESDKDWYVVGIRFVGNLIPEKEYKLCAAKLNSYGRKEPGIYTTQSISWPSPGCSFSIFHFKEYFIKHKSGQQKLSVIMSGDVISVGAKHGEYGPLPTKVDPRSEPILSDEQYAQRILHVPSQMLKNITGIIYRCSID